MRKTYFGKKLYFFSVITASLLTAGFFSIFLWYYISNELESEHIALANMNDIACGNVKDSLELMDTIALQLSTNPIIISAMKDAVKSEQTSGGYNYFASHAMVSEDLHEIIWPYVWNSEVVSAISVYNMLGDRVSVTIDSKEYLPRNSEFLEQLEFDFENEKVYTVFKNELPDYTGSVRGNICIIRKISNSYLIEQADIGYVEISIDIDKLEKTIKFNRDEQITILYDSKTNMLIGTSINNYIENTRWTYKDFLKKMELEEKFYQVDALDNYNINVLTVTANNDYANFVMVVVLLAILLFAIIIYTIGGVQGKVLTALTKPLVELSDAMQDTKVNEERKNALRNSDIYEIDVLARGFSDMIDRLDESMEKEVQTRTSQIKAQLYALQAQMNPHFIHNTIAIIQSYAISEDYDTVIQTCSHLSNLIRYNSKMIQELVTIHEEMMQTRNYMELLKLRYEENIVYTIEVDEVSEQVHMPSFIVQPILENSIAHGLKNKPFPWNIRISSSIQGNNWIIQVEDNGIGISDETIREIMRYKNSIIHSEKEHLLDDNEWKIGGLTMKNIITRLYLEYGKNMIFEITTQLNEYTIIKVGGEKR